MFPSVRTVLSLLLSSLLLASLLPAILKGQTANRAHESGAARLKVDLLGVFAHPDDETGVAATIAALSHGSGRSIAHVYCTRGEGGGNMVGTQSGSALGILREIELRDALRGLGVQQVHFLDRADFAYTESLGVTLERWNHDDTLGRLVRVIRALRPEVVVTMNPAPSPGQHGNHQAAGWLATEAFEAAADPSQFPDQLRLEGLSPWRPRKLFIPGPAPIQDRLSRSRSLAPCPTVACPWPRPPRLCPTTGPRRSEPSRNRLGSVAPPTNGSPRLAVSCPSTPPRPISSKVFRSPRLWEPVPRVGMGFRLRK